MTRLASPNDPQPLNPMISMTVAHVACGALVFATTIVLTLRTFRVVRAPRHPRELILSELSTFRVTSQQKSANCCKHKEG